VSVEAASPLGWSTWIGDDGEAIGMTTFGESAPQPDLYEHFGFTPDNVAKRARAVVERVSART
jgi:transketolase